MDIYAGIPEKFIYSNRSLSNDLAKHEIRIGQVFTNTFDLDKIVGEIAADVIQDFKCKSGVTISAQDAREMVANILPDFKNGEILDTSVFEGEYVVTETTIEDRGCDYPCGYHVTCKRLQENGEYDENGAEVSFYQSGYFTAVIKPENIQPIRVMMLDF
jgi:hypothetical protein